MRNEKNMGYLQRSGVSFLSFPAYKKKYFIFYFYYQVSFMELGVRQCACVPFFSKTYGNTTAMPNIIIVVIATMHSY